MAELLTVFGNQGEFGCLGCRSHLSVLLEEAQVEHLVFGMVAGEMQVRLGLIMESLQANWVFSGSEGR